MPAIVIVVIRRDSGELFVHQRLDSKRSFPGRFGLGAGGTVDAGEQPSVAASRELREETGLEAAPTPLFDFSFQSPDANHHVHVFELVTHDQPGHDTSEWQWSGWMPVAGVDELAQNGRLCPDTRELYERYLALKRSR